MPGYYDQAYGTPSNGGEQRMPNQMEGLAKKGGELGKDAYDFAATTLGLKSSLPDRPGVIKYDPNYGATYWGGTQEGAAEQASWLRANEEGYRMRGAPTDSMSGYYAALAADRTGRHAQEQAADYYRGILNGGPSAAQMQQQRAMQSAAAGASSLASSGGYNPLLARQAMATQAGAQVDAAREGAILRFQEQQAAAAGLGQAGQAMRAGDAALAGLDVQRANVLMQTQLGQTKLNDEMVRAYMAAGMSLEQAQMEARLRIEQLRESNIASMNQAQSAQYASLVQGTSAEKGGMMGSRSALLSKIPGVGGLL